MSSSRKPLPEEVAGILAEEIRAGRIAAGAFLPPEPRLTERFAVSRPVVREATRILAARGLVEVRRGVGVVVRDAPDPNLGDALAARIRSDAGVLRDIWDVRMMLEPAVAAAAAERATAEEVDAIGRAAAALEEAPDPVGADLAFHGAVMQAAHNGVVALILAPLGDLLRAERAATLRMGLDAAARGHRRIAAAIGARDATAARDAMAQHLIEARQGLETALASEGEPVAATDAPRPRRHPG